MGRAWSKAHKAVQPLHLLQKGRTACHHANGRRALSAFNASCPIRWQTASGSSSRRRAWPVCWQTVRPCQAAHCTHHPFYKKPPLHAGDIQISGVRIIEDRSSNRHLRLHELCSPYPWARMSGLSTFMHAPFSYKRGDMRRYKTDPTLGSLRHSQIHTSSQAIHHTVE
jgi:hypothetical protein